MSLKLGTQDISGISQNTKYNAHHLLDFKWTDCIMNDVSWLRADTFSWQSGDVYVSAYNHLVADLQGTTAETETIGSYTVTFYRADDGHKICLADQETTVLDIYNESGIAWYYIVDTVNTRFKLPRTKFGFEGLRSNVGDSIEAGLPQHTHTLTLQSNWGNSNAIANRVGWCTDNATNGSGTATTANASNSIYGNSNTVQPPATQMYLYFYVGDFSQTAVEQTAGLNAGLFNGKADVDLTNCSDTGNTLMAHNAMPSNTYTDLTLGASGTEYTAPADGYVYIGGYTNANAFCYFSLYDAGNSLTNMASGYSTGLYLRGFIPVKKGATFGISYLNFTFDVTRFIYAIGSESEAS